MSDMDLDALRATLADGKCLCSSSRTDWNAVLALIARVEAAEAKVSRVQAVTEKLSAVKPSDVGHDMGYVNGLDAAVALVDAALADDQPEGTR